MKPSVPPGSPGKRGAPPGGPDSASKRQAEESDVKNMFAQLLRGQRTQTEALNTFENKIGQELVGLRKEMDHRDNNMNEKIKAIKKDIDIRIMQVEDRLKADYDAEHGSQASASTAAPRGGHTIHVPPAEDPCRIVFGGWQKPQRKMVVENRVLEIVNACGLTANDIYARKRGQVGEPQEHGRRPEVHVRDQEAAVHDEDDGRRRDHVDQKVCAEERARAHQTPEVLSSSYVRMVGLSGFG